MGRRWGGNIIYTLYIHSIYVHVYVAVVRYIHHVMIATYVSLYVQYIHVQYVCTVVVHLLVLSERVVLMN